MRLLAIIFALVGMFADVPVLAMGIPEKLLCEENSDCTVIESLCPGSWQPVNTRFRSDEEEKIQKMRAVVKCARINQIPQPKPACLGGVCNLLSPLD